MSTYRKRPPRTPTQQTWDGMKNRCRNPSHKGYPQYGGRGITVCERWSGAKGFKNFLADMGERPAGTTLDRIDPDKGYFKENCRWATLEQQARGRRNTVRMTAFGKTQALVEWAEQYGVPMKILRQRVKKYGWTLEEALTHDAVRAPKGTGKSFVRVPRKDLVSVIADKLSTQVIDA